ncbi:DUF3667 domain-containing protein [Povalibacter sp.]|uniref:DUF3667 domain-containing protein n=1 Tax=Povalibacter sp. TaxID=1962978 RepID=UPI002F3FC6A1
MSIEGEAAGDVLTGVVVAATVEGKVGAAGARDVPHGQCRNCGADLNGKYCASCGQPAHIHRALTSLGHDILHGVFHFEGKVWRTIPELYLRPGRLTRRYIDGERAKFVSPMALYLFTVFLTFAVVPFTSTTFLNDAAQAPDTIIGNFKAGNKAAMDNTLAELAKLQAARQQPDLTAERRATIERQIADTQDALKVMNALGRGDWKGLTDFEQEQREKKAAGSNNKVDTGWAALDSRMGQSLQEINDNPRLLLYKLKTNGYKYSWALIPLSLPFMWLLFFWRRDIHLYDHAIFVTYSISFMMQLLVLLSIASALGAGAGLWVLVLGIIPPVHLYKQMRGAYGLSRIGAFVRLFLLTISISIVIALFSVILLLLGVLT